MRERERERERERDSQTERHTLDLKRADLCINCLTLSMTFGLKFPLFFEKSKTQ